MENTLLPIEERNLTPQQVEALDKRRSRGQVCLVIAFQLIILGTVLSLWAGQALTYSPNWIHPMGYYMFLDFTLALILVVVGIGLRRGRPEFSSK